VHCMERNSRDVAGRAGGENSTAIAVNWVRTTKRKSHTVDDVGSNEPPLLGAVCNTRSGSGATISSLFWEGKF